MQNSKQSAHGAVAAILKASKKGCPLANCGVRGRLGDLGSIDEEYDVAISTACGQLDFIVVDIWIFSLPHTITARNHWIPFWFSP